VTRGLVEEAGIDAESGAILYRTSSYFLERMGLADLSELPDIAPMLPEIEEMGEDDWTESVGVPMDEPTPNEPTMNERSMNEHTIETEDPSAGSSTGD
jgi:segregation and condensation protein B